MTDDELLSGFETASLGDRPFGHREHVRVAWLFVRKYGVPEALSRFSDALKGFAQAKGVPQLYHETITWAYLLLIHERMARRPLDNWTEFAGDNPDLLAWKPSLLDRYYTPELLWSEVARGSFVMPDRVPVGDGS
jgi:hypothetical protein